MGVRRCNVHCPIRRLSPWRGNHCHGSFRLDSNGPSGCVLGWKGGPGCAKGSLGEVSVRWRQTLVLFIVSIIQI